MMKSCYACREPACGTPSLPRRWGGPLCNRRRRLFGARPLVAMTGDLHFASDWNDMRELVVFMKNRGWTWNIHHDRAGFVQRDQGFPEDCADSDRLALATVKAAVAALEWEASRA